MKVDVSRLWPRDEVSAVHHWGELAGKLGFLTPQLHPFLIAIRGVEPFKPMSHELVHRGDYDDTFVLLPVESGPVVFKGATHAYQDRSKASPDVDRDGVGDVGSIRTGSYLLHDLKNGAEVIFHVKMPNGDDSIPVDRDFNHDRKLSEAEIQKSRELRQGLQVGPEGTFAKGILVHGGLDEEPGAKHRYSIGCLTIERKWRRLMSEAAKPYGGIIEMKLVTAWSLLPLVDALVIGRDDDGDSDRPPPGERA